MSPDALQVTPREFIHRSTNGEQHVSGRHIMTSHHGQHNDVIVVNRVMHRRTYARREKKWQYADTLQLCIRGGCHGHVGVSFYNCAYKNCIVPRMHQQHQQQQPQQLP